ADRCGGAAPTRPEPRVRAGRRDRDQRHRVQSARRRPARVARPEAEAMTAGATGQPSPAAAPVANVLTPAAPDRPPLSVAGLGVRFKTQDGVIHAVNGVSFDLEPGERLGLVGESGCGKSVTNLGIMRLLPKPAGRIEGGTVRFDGLDLVTLNEADMRDLRGKD